MLKDRFGNEVTTSGLGAIETIDHFSDQLLRLGCETGQVLIAAEAFPENFLLQVYSALFYLFAQTEKGRCRANHFLERSRRLLKTKPTERELSIYEAVKLWSQGQLAEALSHLEKHCLKWRSDLVMLKVTEFIYYCKGQEYEGGRFLSLTQNLYQKWKDDPFFLSMHSFALELTGNYSEAEVESNRALDLDNFNSWAHHTLCHVYINRGETEKGIKALESFVPIWNQSARVIQSHNLWHLALMYLENLDFSSALTVYKRADWNSKIGMVGEEVDAASLLWRLDMEGQDVSDKWEKVAEGIGSQGSFGSIPFVNAQLCYALKRGGKHSALQESLAAIEQFTMLQKGENQRVWTEVGNSLIQGSLAFADQDYKAVLHYFEPIISQIGCCGGSDAQVDLFRQAYLKSLIGVGIRGEAQSFLGQMTKGRGMTPLESKWLKESKSR